MTPAEAIEKLDNMRNAAAMKNMFGDFLGDIADVIRGLQDEVKIVQGWSDKWSTEHRKLTEACKLVLLYHSGRPWDMETQAQWLSSLKAVHGGEFVSEATTKNLCDAVRAALESK